MCVRVRSLRLNALNSDAVLESETEVEVEGDVEVVSAPKGDSGVYKTLAIVAGAGVVLLSAVLVGIYKFSSNGKQQQAQAERPSEVSMEEYNSSSKVNGP